MFWVALHSGYVVGGNLCPLDQRARFSDGIRLRLEMAHEYDQMLSRMSSHEPIDSTLLKTP